MALKTKVLVTNITNLHDARYCAGMGVDMLSFPIDPTLPGTLDAKTLGEMTSWLSGVQVLGEVVSFENLHEFQLDAILTTNPMLLEDQGTFVLKIELDLMDNMNDAASVMQLCLDKSAYFLLSSQKSWKEIPQLSAWAKQFPILVGAKLPVEEMGFFLETVKPAGVALKPGVELKTGMNDLDQLADMLEALESDEY